jgi:hypothetical protein
MEISMSVFCSRFALLIVSLSGLLLSGCNTCTFPDATSSPAPDWVCAESTGYSGTIAVGFADKSAAGNHFSKQLAASNARIALAKKLNLDVSQPQILDNARVLDTATSPNGRIYVLVGISQ